VLAGPVLEVAPRLLNAVLRHVTDDGAVAVRLTEVEAYGGTDDPGSHAYGGRTDRNAAMFGPPSHLYVYFTYGMHFCSNVVVGEKGSPSAVLMRAGEIVEGWDLARSRRAGASDRDLARGPARLCQALGIDGALNGSAFTEGRLVLTPGAAVAPDQVSIGPRVGLREASDRPWRFWITGDPSVSAYRRAAPRSGQR
jgi:DNA-3-methyladenine glycosylase